MSTSRRVQIMGWAFVVAGAGMELLPSITPPRVMALGFIIATLAMATDLFRHASDHPASTGRRNP